MKIKFRRAAELSPWMGKLGWQREWRLALLKGGFRKGRLMRNSGEGLKKKL